MVNEGEYVESPHHKHFPIFLFVAYLLFWTFFAVTPLDRFDWLLENILVFIFVPFLALTYTRFRLSNISYTCIFFFMLLHTLGAHYTYSEVPLGYWLQELFGTQRNFFDRIVHFSFGLLLAYPIREVFHRIASAKGFWAYWLPLELTLAFSAMYEIIEWLAAVSFGSGAAAFLGTQGDEFDAIKDMALAGMGSLISMLVTLAINFKYDKHLGREIERSLEIKEKEPLGEVRLKELEEEKKPSLAEKFARFRKGRDAPAAPVPPAEDAELESTSSFDKHDHTPEEILKLLQGENVHRGRREGGSKPKRKNSRVSRPRSKGKTKKRR